MDIRKIPNQLQLHRHLPLVRRVFWQRDQARAERDAALARLADAELQRDVALRRLKEVPKAPDERRMSSAFTLPPEFHPVSITGDDGLTWQIVIEGEGAPAYDRWVAENKVNSEIARLLVHILSGGGTLIDLGANIGTICVPVAAAGSRVIAVEMLPRNTMKLILAASLNRFDRFRIVQAAATDHDGFVWYAGDEAWAQVSKMPTTAQAVGMRLDTMIDLIERESPDFIRRPLVMKIDIEGHELAALRGAERLLAAHRPTFVFESIQEANVNPEKGIPLKEYVLSKGYQLYLLRYNVLSPHLKDDLQISPVSDILAIPNETSASVFQRLTSYSVRHLTPQEQLEWLEEVSKAGFGEHAAAVRSKISLSPRESLR
jgi:FkbM family methyltransferase